MKRFLIAYAASGASCSSPSIGIAAFGVLPAQESVVRLR